MSKSAPTPAAGPTLSQWGSGAWESVNDRFSNLGSGANFAWQAAPVIAVALATYAIFQKIQASISWNVDLREHRQSATNFYNRVNAMIILGSIISAALLTLKVLPMAASAGAVLGVFSGVTVMSLGLLAANYVVYQRSVQHDGRHI